MKSKNKIILIYFTLLLTTLSFIYLPSFFNAPRSDWWETLYFFHTIYASSNPYQWLHIFNSDCHGHVTFRPLSHLLLYFQHLVFGSHFYYLQIVNFCLYCISLLLLYRFILFFTNNNLFTAIFIGYFALLFSHFDIVSWTAHSYLIFAFCAFLLGFILYVKFLNSGRNILLFFVGILFLLGMFCYEAFAIWPLSIIILGYIGTLINKEKFTRFKLLVSCLSVITAVYILYIAVFFLTRSINTYSDSCIKTHLLFVESMSIKRIWESGLAASFNILGNGFLTNIMPTLVCPLWVNPVSSNILMSGFIMKLNPIIVYMQISAIILSAFFISIIIYLYKHKQFDNFKIFLFLFFLLFTFSFLLNHAKHFSNKEYLYNFRQFRFQYVTNAIIAMIVLFLFSRVVKMTRRFKIALFSTLFTITLLNAYLTVYYISFESNQLAPLNRMLTNIRRGIESGQINGNKKIYIDDNIVNSLPLMCWNFEMGKKFMNRTYQWIFNKNEIKYFAYTIEDASWVIDRNDFGIKSKVNSIDKK